MHFTHCFFDLDGTLIDSEPGITHSVQYALRKCGIDPPPANRLTGFIGPPLTWGFSHFFGMSDEDSHRAVEFYREYYRAGGMLECRVYDGIQTLLQGLQEAGVCCVLATCKPYAFAEAILQHFALDRFFSFVSGPEMDGRRGEKPEVIEHAMKTLGLSDPGRILMIGDRDSDIAGAHQHGLAAAGVLWGFGTKQELQYANADFLCATPAELKSVIL